MRVPKSFKEVTVEQYQEILPIYLKDKEGIDTWVNIIAILCDCQNEDIEGLPIGELKSIIKSLGWLVNNKFHPYKRKYVWLNGRLHKATFNAEDFNTAQFHEVETWLTRGDSVKQLHNLLASIYSPFTWRGFVYSGKGHAERAKAFKKKSVGKLYPTVFFYSKAYKDYTKRIAISGIKEAKKQLRIADKLLAQTLKEDLESIGVGT